MNEQDQARCHDCKRRGSKAVCFPVPVSRLEAALGQERFKCECCGREWKIVFSTVGACSRSGFLEVNP